MNVALRLLMRKASAATLSGSYIGGDTSGGSVAGAVVTFSSVGIGAAASDRTVVVGITGNATGTTPPTVTIGGVSATLVTNNGDTCTIYKAAVPTGTTAAIVVTYAGAPSQTTCVHVWRITGTINQTNVANTSANGITVSRTVTGYTGGFIVAVTYMQTGSVNTTWTNATERYDVSVGVIDRSGADSTAVGSTTITTGNGVVKTREMAVAAFGP